LDVYEQHQCSKRHLLETTNKPGGGSGALCSAVAQIRVGVVRREVYDLRLQVVEDVAHPAENDAKQAEAVAHEVGIHHPESDVTATNTAQHIVVVHADKESCEGSNDQDEGDEKKPKVSAASSSLKAVNKSNKIKPRTKELSATTSTSEKLIFWLMAAARLDTLPLGNLEKRGANQA